MNEFKVTEDYKVDFGKLFEERKNAYKNAAKDMRSLYDSYIDVGFTPMAALELVKTVVLGSIEHIGKQK